MDVCQSHGRAVRPDIFRYLDYRQFLSDQFGFFAAKNKKFSRRWLAQRAGLKSPQLISMILKGSRSLSIENALLLSSVLSLSVKEEEYLLILIELENASHREKQLEILDRIRFQFQNGLFKDLPDTGFEYIKKWFYLATRELVSVKNFALNASSVALALGINDDEAQEAIDTLLKHGFLETDGAVFKRVEPSIRAANHASPFLMMQFHLQILERAFQAVQLKREFRHFDSLIVALPADHVATVRDKIQQFIREIDMLGETAARREDVFQLSIQFFSLTAGRLKES